MVLEPGDEVKEDQCEQVGNFPHGLLTNPDALALDPNAFGSSMCLNSKKQDYIDAFDANDLIVCNEEQFAKLNTPYIVYLKVEEGEEPSEADKRWLYSITVTGQSFKETETCRAAMCGGCLYYSEGVPNPCGYVFTWTSDIGNCAFSAKMHEYMIDRTGDESVCPSTSIYGCECFCSQACDGTIEIESFWDAETMNRAYLMANGISFFSVEVAKIKVTITGPFGVKTVERSMRVSGSTGSSSVSASWECWNDGNVFNTTSQSVFANIHVSGVVLDRWQFNYNLINRPECMLPPPGTSWPPIIDDPSHDDY